MTIKDQIEESINDLEGFDCELEQSGDRVGRRTLARCLAVLVNSKLHIHALECQLQQVAS